MLKVTTVPFCKFKKAAYDEKYICVAESKEVEHKSMLVFHFYVKEAGKHEPVLQLYCTEDDFQVVYADGKTSRKNVSDIIRISSCKCVSGEEVARDFFESFFCKRGKDASKWNVEQCIVSYQENIKYQQRAEKEKRRLKKEAEDILPDMKLFRKVDTCRYNKRIRGTVFKDVSYLFYDKVAKTGYCNVCDKETDLSGMTLSHNMETKCPACGKSVTMKNVNRGKGVLQFIRWSIKVEAKGGKVITRYFSHYWDLSKNYKNQTIETNELIRSVFKEELTRVDYSYNYDKYTDTYDWGLYKEIRGFMGQDPSEHIRPRNIYLYNTLSELNRAIKNTAYKYSGLVEFLQGYMNDDRYMAVPYMLDNYLTRWSRKPCLEKFAKVGFVNLVIELINNYPYSGFHCATEEDTTLPKLIGVSKEHFKWLFEKGNPAYRDVRILKEYPEISKKDFFMLVSFPDYTSNADAYMECKKYTTLHKLNKYLQEQGKDARYYRDYLRMSEELGYDMKNTFNLFPKNLVERHDERAEEKRLKKEQLDKERLDAYNAQLAVFEERNKKALEEGSFEDVRKSKFLMIGDLMIRLPHTVDEIKKEGEILHHCVGGYTKSVIEGKTEIFFIRRTSEPDKPFYTLEWKDNEVKQCYGFKNCDRTPEVGAFVNTFAQLMTTGSMQTVA